MRNASARTLRELRAIPVRGMGEVRPGRGLADTIRKALARQKLRLESGDILVVTHKVVSKTEAQIVPLRQVKPSRVAWRWAKRHKVDARVVELALSQARRVVRMERGVLITQTRHGLVCANSGVDLSNVDGGRSAVLLPHDPDRSAEELRRALKQRTGLDVPVIITDSFGRPWREGLTDVAIGIAGMKPFRDYRGRRDAAGYRLRASLEAVADELAAVAGVAGGKLSRTPACIIRGFRYERGRGRARDLARPAARDLFR
ncbi:MAG: coenzyme F420-0:L-glutamate ligase [Acidobacteria bacterium]|nr:coenzyme F420-0:L-glutamate ligase [Acidobacteriota bacterium]